MVDRDLISFFWYIVYQFLVTPIHHVIFLGLFMIYIYDLAYESLYAFFINMGNEIRSVIEWIISFYC